MVFYKVRKLIIKINQIHQLQTIKINNKLKYHIYSFGNKNPNKKFYVIQRYKGGGMFSNLVYVIHHIKIALEMDCIPIIDMDNFPTKYNEKKRDKSIRSI